jgi:hypothetical protein
MSLEGAKNATVQGTKDVCCVGMHSHNSEIVLPQKFHGGNYVVAVVVVDKEAPWTPLGNSPRVFFPLGYPAIKKAGVHVALVIHAHMKFRPILRVCRVLTHALDDEHGGPGGTIGTHTPHKRVVFAGVGHRSEHPCVPPADINLYGRIIIVRNSVLTLKEQV